MVCISANRLAEKVTQLTSCRTRLCNETRQKVSGAVVSWMLADSSSDSDRKPGGFRWRMADIWHAGSMEFDHEGACTSGEQWLALQAPQWSTSGALLQLSEFSMDATPSVMLVMSRFWYRWVPLAMVSIPKELVECLVRSQLFQGKKGFPNSMYTSFQFSGFGYRLWIT